VQEQILFVASLSAIFGALSLILNYKNYKKQNTPKLVFSSSLVMSQDVIEAEGLVINSGKSNITIERVSLSIPVWSKSPKIKFRGLVRYLEIFKPDYDIEYLGHEIARYDRDKILCESSKLSVHIPLEELMESYFSHREYLGRFFFLLVAFTLKFNVCTTTGGYKYNANWKIRYWLWSHYKNDQRLTG